MELAVAQQRPAGNVRRESLFGREHFVVPAVAVREQVLHNNVGAMYLPAEEIEASVSAWNFTPVTMGHPTRQGQPVSARDPDVVNSRAVGILFNARYEDRALKVDVYIDPEQARNVRGGEELLAQLESGEPVEVSTGFSFTAENRTGEFEGEDFEVVAHNLGPDHFAVGVAEGACSVEDGCGLGVNCNCEEPMDAENADKVADSLWERFMAHLTRREKMDDEQIQALSDATGLDAERLAEMEEEDLEALAANVLDSGEEPEDDTGGKASDETPEDAPEWAKNLVGEVRSLREDVDEVREAAEPAVNEYRAERERLISGLAANDRCPFDEDELDNKGLEELRKLDSMAKNRDYSGRGGPKRDVAGSDLPELDFEVGDPWSEPAEA